MRAVLPVLLSLGCSLTGQAVGKSPSTKDWVRRLAAKRFDTREKAKAELAARGLQALPTLDAILQSGNARASKSVRDIFVRIGPAVVPHLIENVDGEDTDTRYYSITALGDLAPASAAAIPVIARALEDFDTRVAYEAAWALASFREKAAPATPALIEVLSHEEPLVRTTAAGALAAIGKNARAAVPALLLNLLDTDGPTRRASAEALAAIGVQKESAVAPLVAALDDNNLYVQMSAARVLGTMGAKAKGATDDLRQRLATPALAADVAWALTQITGEKVSAPAPKAVASGPLEVEAPNPADGWRMLGGEPGRNAVASAKGIPLDWNVRPERHVLWSVELGNGNYGGPIVGGGRVFVGAGNEIPFRHGLDGACGTMLAFDAETGAFLWQDHAENPGRQADFMLPMTTCSPLLEGDRLYYMTAHCQLRCLDVRGFRDKENDGPYKGEKDTGEKAADRIWELDIPVRLGVFPHEAANCSVIAAGNVLLVCTSNGVDEAHTRVPAPRAPSFIGVDKATGRVLWTCSGPGKNILHGQWSSPSLGRVGKRTLAFFGGGDGWLYALDPRTGAVVWKFDGNRSDAVWHTGSDFGRVVRRNPIIACPLFAGGRVYLGLGQDPAHGRGKALLHAIDPTGHGDVSHSHRLWTCSIGRTISTPILHEGLLFVGDHNGFVHCLEAKTGKRLWQHDTGAPIWGGMLLLGDRLLVGNEDGVLMTFGAGRAKKLLKERDLTDPIYAGPVVHAGRLYVATSARLFAIGTRD